LFGLIAAVLAAVIHAFLAYITVTGFQVDWIEWSSRKVVESGVAAGGLGLGTALSVIALGTIAGTATWLLARRGTIRGEADDDRELDDSQITSWSEFTWFQSVGIAAFGGVLAAAIGFLLAEREEVVLDGQTFFWLQLVLGVAITAIAVAVLVRALANAYANDVIQLENPNGNVISRVQLWSAENAVTVVIVTVLVVSSAGVGVTKIETDVEVSDLLPRGNENTKAAENVSREFKSTFTRQVTWQLEKAPQQCEQDAKRVLGEQRASEIDCQNITAEPYVRATEEIYQMALEDEDVPIEFTIGMNSFYKLINWTIAGGQTDRNADGRAAFSLPPPSMASCRTESTPDETPEPAGQTSGCYQTVNETVWASIPGTVTPVIDPTFDQTASLYLVPPTYEGSSKGIGEAMIDFKQDYVTAVEEGETKWKIWGEDNPPLFTVDIPVANAHQSQLAQEDFETLFPLIFGFIIVALYFSFRSFTAIGITGATLLNAAIITYGGMGWLDIPLNSLNLTVLPLILGNGIDYAIHQTTEFAHSKDEGLTDAEALRESGGKAGFAMFIATVTTVSGLLVMTISPSLAMAQVGLLAAIAMISVYLLTVTFMPAMLALVPTSEEMGESFEPSGITRKLAATVSRNRVVVAGLVILLTGAAVVGTQNLTIEEFGEPAQNFPEGDWLREEHQEGISGFYNLNERGATELKTNVVVFEGDNTDLQSHDYMRSLQNTMADKENLDLSTSRTVPFLIETWLTVKDGTLGAGEQISRDTLQCQSPPGPLEPPPNCQPTEQANNYPTTRTEIQGTMDNMFASPLSTFASLFADHPEYNISVMTLATRTGDFADARDAWEDVQASIDETEEQRPQDTRVAFVGNTALNYLFITEELPWLSYLGYVAGAMLLFLTAIFTKSLRAVLAVGSVLTLTSVWWLGMLPAFDIGLAITLMLPAVFITSIGSDYAIHTTWNIIQSEDRGEVYGVVGKAVMFSAITDIGAFAIFTQTQNVAASQAMQATVLAIGIMFAATFLTLPLFYPWDPAETDEPEEEPTYTEAPKTRVVESGA